MADGMASQDRDVGLAILLAAFLHATFGEMIPNIELQPEFLAPLENHTVTQGRDIFFTCVVNHLQLYKVAWIKSDSRAILAIHTHMVAHNPRLSVTHNGHNTWKLHVANVQRNDSGTYMCQVNTDPMRSQMGYMEVVIPPDIMDVDDSTESLTTVEGGDLRLRCRATGTPRPDVTWRREDGRNIILRDSQGSKRAVKTHEGEQLHLVGVLRQEMGSYLCIATNGVPPSVSKRYFVRVHFEPLIKVVNQLVAAPRNSNVVIQCYAEASPRAMNTWYKDNGGEKLLPSDKYVMSEVAISDYAYQLNLTIRVLEKWDFGSYICSSSNAFGKADGAIRLQELHLTNTTLPSVRHTESGNRARKKQWTDKKSEKPVFGDEQEEFDIIGYTTPAGVKRNPKPPLLPPSLPVTPYSSAPSAPPHLVILNDAASLHFCQLDCRALTMTVMAVGNIMRLVH